VSETVELSCREMVELVTGYLEGSMNAPDRVRFEEHLRNCDGCANYLEQMRTTVRLTGTLEEDVFSPGQLDRLTRAFREWRRG
jgi:predicted anti-sigma-YlaC factor YlaD